MVTLKGDHAKRLQEFTRARRVNACCGLLGLNAFQLHLLAQQPEYYSFKLPKSRYDIRVIEDPSPPLKEVQRLLNAYLQSVYFFEKSRASYGFVAGAANASDLRNILTNARKHLRRPFLYQVDLQDFFHFVTEDMVFKVFTSKPLSFTKTLAGLLTGLTTFQGRLPMGAPTSPVLSNLVCRILDEKLIQLARINRWVFTRYADDFSFSSMQPFTDAGKADIRSIVESEGFRINSQKTRQFGPEEEKIVTGILLRGNGELRPDFLKEVRQEVQNLKHVMEAQNFYGVSDTNWVTKMKQQLQGKIAFVGFVLGKKHPDFLDIRQAFKAAKRPPKDMFGAVSWKGFHYLV